MELKDLPFFKCFNESTVNEIIAKSKFYKYQLGQPISDSKTIPNLVSIIIEGEARLLSNEDNEVITIAKLGPGTIIGLVSLLRAEGCEKINASCELKALSIPDELIIQLYKDHKTFKDFCNTNIFPGEILAISEKKPQKRFMMKLVELKKNLKI